jgi:endonuclease G
MRATLVAILVIVLPVLALAQEFHVEASRTAIIRADPSTSSEETGRLERGDRLNAVTDEQTESFYHVYLLDGTPGWVSRYVVRLYPGPAEGVPGVPIAPGVGGGLSREEEQSAAFHLAIGKPLGYREIFREGYTVGYDPKLKIPVWVQYRLTAAHSADNTYERTDSFEADGVVPPMSRAVLDDYEDLGGDYVRGHMAPAEDMRWSRSAEDESNRLTNIAPQIGSTYNGSVWKTLENRVRDWVMDREDLTIICGPVFEARGRVEAIARQPETDRQMLFNVIGGNDVAVPTAFFKIVVDMRNAQNPDVLAFLIPHMQTERGPERDIETYLVSVDEIEEATGLDFLTALPETVQEAVESVTAQASW